MANPLDPRSLLALVASLAPSVHGSSPLPHPTDAAAALVHAIHTALDFRLVPSTPTPQDPDAGVQNEPTELDACADDDAQSETATAVDPDEGQPPENALPATWNARGEDSYMFEYRHGQSAMTFRVRVGRMGNRIQVDAMPEDGPPHTISLLVNDLLDASAFPVPPSQAANAEGDAEARVLGFRSLDTVRTFIDQYNRGIIARLIPGLQKEGYRAPLTSSAPRVPRPDRPHQPEPSGGPARPSPLMDPLHPAAGPAGVPAASVGHRDLDPLGGRTGPGFNRPDFDRGGGMLVDFNHPLFDGRRGDGREQGPGGIMNPPGSRWDPVGPVGPLGPRFPSAGGNPLGGFGTTDPEWGDEMPPPGEHGPDPSGRFGPRRGGGGGGGFGGPGMGVSHNGHRGSISMPAPSFAASFQEEPLYFIREVSPAPPYEAHTQHVPYDEDMDLETAFAGDAFAPLHQAKEEDAWAAFRQDSKSAFAFSFGDKQQPAVATFQFQMQQPQSAPQYETDEDAAEAMITEE
ncbi:hypothetical protein CspHIS471_0700270 [Cutaneotrichosporon sp. HIS471]|nr:hypothetical protein CspHIS471_0700270 [Cutaneotrichosporon sp. HIS471]